MELDINNIRQYEFVLNKTDENGSLANATLNLNGTSGSQSISKELKTVNGVLDITPVLSEMADLSMSDWTLDVYKRQR